MTPLTPSTTTPHPWAPSQAPLITPIFCPFDSVPLPLGPLSEVINVWTPTQATSLPNTFPWSLWCKAMPPTHTLVGHCGPAPHSQGHHGPSATGPRPSVATCGLPVLPALALLAREGCPAHSPHTPLPPGFTTTHHTYHPHVDQCPPTNWSLLPLAMSHFLHQVLLWKILQNILNKKSNLV